MTRYHFLPKGRPIPATFIRTVQAEAAEGHAVVVVTAAKAKPQQSAPVSFSLKRR